MGAWSVSGALARRLWQVVEPLHAVVYFAPEPADAAKSLGLRGWWMGYFAGRAAPMGTVAAPVVAAAFFGFHPAMVARSIPDAWDVAAPDAVVGSRAAAAAAALRRILGRDIDEVASTFGAELRAAVTAMDRGGRPLAAAWAAVEPTGDPVVDLWLACSVLREHRGDSHVIACVAHGLGPLEATVTMVADGRIPRASIQPHRGWSDADWSAAEQTLTGRGLLLDGQLTAAGVRCRADVEDATDRLAARPVDALGEARVTALVEALTPLAQRVVDDGTVPVPNPIGVGRPA
jgi:hypothetical protein